MVRHAGRKTLNQAPKAPQKPTQKPTPLREQVKALHAKVKEKVKKLPAAKKFPAFKKGMDDFLGKLKTMNVSAERKNLALKEMRFFLRRILKSNNPQAYQALHSGLATRLSHIKRGLEVKAKVTHVVKPGDTFNSIIKKHFGSVSQKKLWVLVGIFNAQRGPKANPQHLFLGEAFDIGKIKKLAAKADYSTDAVKKSIDAYIAGNPSATYLKSLKRYRKSLDKKPKQKQTPAQIRQNIRSGKDKLPTLPKKAEQLKKAKLLKGISDHIQRLLSLKPGEPAQMKKALAYLNNALARTEPGYKQRYEKANSPEWKATLKARGFFKQKGIDASKWKSSMKLPLPFGPAERRQLMGYKMMLQQRLSNLEGRYKLKKGQLLYDDNYGWVIGEISGVNDKGEATMKWFEPPKSLKGGKLVALKANAKHTAFRKKRYGTLRTKATLKSNDIWDVTPQKKSPLGVSKLPAGVSLRETNKLPNGKTQLKQPAENKLFKEFQKSLRKISLLSNKMLTSEVLSDNRSELRFRLANYLGTLKGQLAQTKQLFQRFKNNLDSQNQATVSASLRGIAAGSIESRAQYAPQFKKWQENIKNIEHKITAVQLILSGIKKGKTNIPKDKLNQLKKFAAKDLVLKELLLKFNLGSNPSNEKLAHMRHSLMESYLKQGNHMAAISQYNQASATLTSLKVKVNGKEQSMYQPGSVTLRVLNLLKKGGTNIFDVKINSAADLQALVPKINELRKGPLKKFLPSAKEITAEVSRLKSIENALNKDPKLKAFNAAMKKLSGLRARVLKDFKAKQPGFFTKAFKFSGKLLDDPNTWVMFAASMALPGVGGAIAGGITRSLQAANVGARLTSVAAFTGSSVGMGLAFHASSNVGQFVTSAGQKKGDWSYGGFTHSIGMMMAFGGMGKLAQKVQNPIGRFAVQHGGAIGGMTVLEAGNCRNPITGEIDWAEALGRGMTMHLVFGLPGMAKTAGRIQHKGEFAKLQKRTQKSLKTRNELMQKLTEAKTPAEAQKIQRKIDKNSKEIFNQNRKFMKLQVMETKFQQQALKAQYQQGKLSKKDYAAQSLQLKQQIQVLKNRISSSAKFKLRKSKAPDLTPQQRKTAQERIKQQQQEIQRDFNLNKELKALNISPSQFKQPSRAERIRMKENLIRNAKKIQQGLKEVGLEPLANRIFGKSLRSPIKLKNLNSLNQLLKDIKALKNNPSLVGGAENFNAILKAVNGKNPLKALQANKQIQNALSGEQVVSLQKVARSKTAQNRTFLQAMQEVGTFLHAVVTKKTMPNGIAPARSTTPQNKTASPHKQTQAYDAVKTAPKTPKGAAQGKVPVTPRSNIKSPHKQTQAYDAVKTVPKTPKGATQGKTPVTPRSNIKSPHKQTQTVNAVQGKTTIRTAPTAPKTTKVEAFTPQTKIEASTLKKGDLITLSAETNITGKTQTRNFELQVVGEQAGFIKVKINSFNGSKKIPNEASGTYFLKKGEALTQGRSFTITRSIHTRNHEPLFGKTIKSLASKPATAKKQVDAAKTQVDLPTTKAKTQVDAAKTQVDLPATKAKTQVDAAKTQVDLPAQKGKTTTTPKKAAKKTATKKPQIDHDKISLKFEDATPQQYRELQQWGLTNIVKQGAPNQGARMKYAAQIHQRFSAFKAQCQKLNLNFNAMNKAFAKKNLPLEQRISLLQKAIAKKQQALKKPTRKIDLRNGQPTQVRISQTPKGAAQGKTPAAPRSNVRSSKQTQEFGTTKASQAPTLQMNMLTGAPTAPKLSYAQKALNFFKNNCPTFHRWGKSILSKLARKPKNQNLNLDKDTIVELKAVTQEVKALPAAQKKAAKGILKRFLDWAGWSGEARIQKMMGEIDVQVFKENQQRLAQAKKQTISGPKDQKITTQDAFAQTMQTPAVKPKKVTTKEAFAQTIQAPTLKDAKPLPQSTQDLVKRQSTQKPKTNLKTKEAFAQTVDVPALDATQAMRSPQKTATYAQAKNILQPQLTKLKQTEKNLQYLEQKLKKGEVTQAQYTTAKQAFTRELNALKKTITDTFKKFSPAVQAQLAPGLNKTTQQQIVQAPKQSLPTGKQTRNVSAPKTAPQTPKTKPQAQKAPETIEYGKSLNKLTPSTLKKGDIITIENGPLTYDFQVVKAGKNPQIKVLGGTRNGEPIPRETIDSRFKGLETKGLQLGEGLISKATKQTPSNMRVTDLNGNPTELFSHIRSIKVRKAHQARQNVQAPKAPKAPQQKPKKIEAQKGPETLDPQSLKANDVLEVKSMNGGQEVTIQFFVQKGGATPSIRILSVNGKAPRGIYKDAHSIVPNNASVFKKGGQVMIRHGKKVREGGTEMSLFQKFDNITSLKVRRATKQEIAAQSQRAKEAVRKLQKQENAVNKELKKWDIELSTFTNKNVGERIIQKQALVEKINSAQKEWQDAGLGKSFNYLFKNVDRPYGKPQQFINIDARLSFLNNALLRNLKTLKANPEYVGGQKAYDKMVKNLTSRLASRRRNAIGLYIKGRDAYLAAKFPQKPTPQPKQQPKKKAAKVQKPKANLQTSNIGPKQQPKKPSDSVINIPKAKTNTPSKVKASDIRFAQPRNNKQTINVSKPKKKPSDSVINIPKQAKQQPKAPKKAPEKVQAPKEAEALLGAESVSSFLKLTMTDKAGNKLTTKAEKIARLKELLPELNKLAARFKKLGLGDSLKGYIDKSANIHQNILRLNNLINKREFYAARKIESAVQHGDVVSIQLQKGDVLKIDLRKGHINEMKFQNGAKPEVVSYALEGRNAQISPDNLSRWARTDKYTVRLRTLSNGDKILYNGETKTLTVLPKNGQHQVFTLNKGFTPSQLAARQKVK